MRVLRGLGRLWLVPVVLVAWEAATRAAEDNFFPPPTAIAVRMHEMWLSGPPERLWLTDAAVENIPTSVGRLFAGWLLAGAIGITLGLMLGRSPVLSRFLDPLIEFGRAIPPPALLPFFLALFAAGAQMQIATIVFGIIWPILLNAGDGARHVDRQHLETSRVFGFSRSQRLLRVILPSAMPKIFAGLRLSLSLALILMVISELVGSTNGIGFQLLDAQRSFDLPGVWGTIVVLGVLGYVLNSAFLVAERRLLSWHRAAKQTI
ncbi:ABC transporter permease [Planomonospora parontospora]|uniref:ABC transporter permease n=1 Tax=Planomonospora parontospora TaxID=58119 RepID=UPI001670732C|nr:ABC transporter permease [Planomonospora parontospora]GGL31946.1 nitrate ABC transporter permease [Planomonospora parontospora subsp. antibiotica]GII16867.1 nitrate ABC transporter permease [Planomonospora parontospora subsp. antibiotica]